MINVHFEHQLIRKYIIVFGTTINNIVIGRSDGTDPVFQKFKVPLQYGPREKFLAITTAKPDRRKEKAILLPRMSFELTGMSFDSTRKIERRQIIHEQQRTTLRGAPWNINFQLNIMTKGSLDATKIVEQILFYFQPDYTVDVKLIDNMEHLDRISIIYNSVSHQDVYEGDFKDRRMTMWTIDFTLKGWLYGAVSDKKQIKFIDVRVHPSDDPRSMFSRTTIQPGLTSAGEPTTDPDQTIDFSLIMEDGDWDVITQQFDNQIP